MWIVASNAFPAASAFPIESSATAGPSRAGKVFGSDPVPIFTEKTQPPAAKSNPAMKSRCAVAAVSAVQGTLALPVLLAKVSLLLVVPKTPPATMAFPRKATEAMAPAPKGWAHTNAPRLL